MKEDQSQNKDVNILPPRIKTIRVEVNVWNSLKSLKNENETFNDLLKKILQQRTISAGDKNVQAIRYKRNISFFTSYDFPKEIGYEFEYNDVKSHKFDFTMDVVIKKIFYEKRVLSPSEFFGVDNVHKHYSDFFLYIYFKAFSLALFKEFRIKLDVYRNDKSYENITQWRKLYYEYQLSEDSFIHDIEEPLRLSVDEKASQDWKKEINKSVVTDLEVMEEEIRKKNPK
ncbi:hypothetical protein HYT51_00510 [Candidatus Woesearchaeota archaeon]|nr:hypothetical protein [Candidatus Woesearchaeota archaeon]